MNLDYKVIPVGERAIMIDFPEKIDVAQNQLIHALADELKKLNKAEIMDLIPAYHTLTIDFDPFQTDFQAFKFWVQDFLATHLAEARKTILKRVVEIPVCYGGKFGPDLIDVAKFAGVTTDEVIKMHTSQLYYIYLLGFLPGFAYAGFVEDQIAMPRLAKPRLKIPAGSVGIAGKQTGMYPVTSPGGWRLIGQTPLKLYDSKSPVPFYQAGDWLKFIAVSVVEFEKIKQQSIRGDYQFKTYIKKDQGEE